MASFFTTIQNKWGMLQKKKSDKEEKKWIKKAKNR